MLCACPLPCPSRLAPWPPTLQIPLQEGLLKMVDDFKKWVCLDAENAALALPPA